LFEEDVDVVVVSCDIFFDLGVEVEDFGAGVARAVAGAGAVAVGVVVAVVVAVVVVVVLALVVVVALALLTSSRFHCASLASKLRYRSLRNRGRVASPPNTLFML